MTEEPGGEIAGEANKDHIQSQCSVKDFRLISKNNRTLMKGEWQENLPSVTFIYLVPEDFVS